MPNKCCVPFCKGNYTRENAVHIFSFPKDDHLAKLWLRAIKRDNFTPTCNTKVCELHFKAEDIEWNTSYFDERTGTTLTARLLKPRIRRGAVPSRLPNCPSYHSATNPGLPSEECQRIYAVAGLTGPPDADDVLAGTPSHNKSTRHTASDCAGAEVKNPSVEFTLLFLAPASFRNFNQSIAEYSSETKSTACAGSGSVVVEGVKVESDMTFQDEEEFLSNVEVESDARSCNEEQQFPLSVKVGSEKNSQDTCAHSQEERSVTSCAEVKSERNSQDEKEQSILVAKVPIANKTQDREMSMSSAEMQSEGNGQDEEQSISVVKEEIDLNSQDEDELFISSRKVDSTRRNKGQSKEPSSGAEVDNDKISQEQYTQLASGVGVKSKRDRHGQMSKERFKCEKCGKTYYDSATLSRHRRSHEGIRNYLCHICGKLYCRLDNFRQHVFLHEAKENSCTKSYTCQQCGRKFLYNSQFKAHTHTHTGERNHECQECGRKFIQKCTLKQHMSTHSAIKPFQCQMCGKKFNRKSDLKEHMSTHSGIRPYQCQKCGKKFVSKATLRTHAISHAPSKQMKCDICGKYFKGRKYIVRHMRVHM